MRPLLLALAVLLAGSAAPAAAQGFSLEGLRGERLSEADLAQGATIIVVWTTWSPNSRNIDARVNPMVQRWSGKARVATVSFQEDRQAVEAFLAGKSFGATVFLDVDGVFSKKYAVATVPYLLILKDGRAVYRGKLPDNPDKVIAESLG